MPGGGIDKKRGCGTLVSVRGIPQLGPKAAQQQVYRRVHHAGGRGRRLHSSGLQGWASRVWARGWRLCSSEFNGGDGAPVGGGNGSVVAFSHLELGVFGLFFVLRASKRARASVVTRVSFAWKALASPMDEFRDDGSLSNSSWIVLNSASAKSREVAGAAF